MRRIVFSYPVLCTLFWAFFILLLCATPGQYLPEASWLEMLSVDKWVHASVFFVLCVLSMTIALKYRHSVRLVFLYFSACVVYGLLMELMQAWWFSNRSADWLDVMANTMGCLCAVLFYRKLAGLYEKYPAFT